MSSKSGLTGLAGTFLSATLFFAPVGPALADYFDCDKLPGRHGSVTSIGDTAWVTSYDVTKGWPQMHFVKGQDFGKLKKQVEAFCDGGAHPYDFHQEKGKGAPKPN